MMAGPTLMILGIQISVRTRSLMSQLNISMVIMMGMEKMLKEFNQTAVSTLPEHLLRMYLDVLIAMVMVGQMHMMRSIMTPHNTLTKMEMVMVI